MADASGTPSTNYSIPKLNTAVDPPSGKGENTIVDFIDNLLKTKFTEKPTGILSGEVPVWNGSGWARSTVTQLAVDSILAPQVQAGSAAAQSITNSTTTDLNQYTAANKNVGGWTIGSSTTFTVPQTGVYMCVGYGQWAANATGVRVLNVIASAASWGQNFTEDSRSAAATGTTEQTVAALLAVASGATIKMQVFQTSGGALNLSIATFYAIRVA